MFRLPFKTHRTERDRPSQRKSPRTPSPDPLLFSIVNIENIAPLFSFWNIEFVLRVHLDHAPPLIPAAITG